MRVIVLLPGVLRDKAGGASQLTLDVAEQATLGDLLDVLAKEHPALERRLRDERAGLRRYVNFYVDGEECRFSGGAQTPLRDDVEVQIIPSVAGG
jgi:molybdopterin synthase sulfur carrier subunit